MSSVAEQLDVRISKRYSGLHPFTLDVSFTISDEIAVTFGASGAGKTTILECISGLSAPDGGRVALGDSVLFDSAAKRNIAVRERRVGYVFQTLALFPHLTAKQNIAYGLQNLDPAERQQRIAEVLEAFCITHVKERKPAAMSGGEQQRVALARSLVTEPRILLLDEPMSALDYETKTGILADLRRWHSQHRIPVLYVTHSIDEVFAIGNRVLRLSEGNIVADGKPAEVLAVELERLKKDLQSAGN